MSEITRTPGVQGGEPCVAGTRTPVRSVAIYHHDLHGGDVARVQASLPHLTLEQIVAALDYYQDHKAEIDALIERQRAAGEALRARSP